MSLEMIRLKSFLEEASRVATILLGMFLVLTESSKNYL